MSGKQYTYSYAELQRLAAKYEQNPYFNSLPLALHPLLLFIPFVGSIVVFIQTAEFIKAIDGLARVPVHSRREMWISTWVLLFIGMMPLFGALFTIYFKISVCSDYLLETNSYVQQNAYFYQQQYKQNQIMNQKYPPMLVSPTDTVKTGFDTVATMSPFAEPTHPRAASVKSTRSISVRSVHEDNAQTNLVHSVSLNNHSTSSLGKLRVKSKKKKSSSTKHTKVTKPEDFVSTSEMPDRVAISVQEPETSRRHDSVFNRVSRMDWMEEVMALSPTDNYRTSLSVAPISKSRSQTTHYTDLRDLASRNSRIHPTMTSTMALPIYLQNPEVHKAADTIKSADSSDIPERMVHSLHLDDSVLDKRESLSQGFRLLKRPDYSHLKSNGSSTENLQSTLTKSSSMTDLARVSDTL